MPEITRRSLFRGGALAATAIYTSKVFGSAPTASAAPLTGFAVAYNAVNISPITRGWGVTWMGGYGWGNRYGVADEAARPITAHCLAITDNGSINVLLRADVVSVPHNIHDQIRNRVVDELGIASSDFLMASSHTHSGPFIGTSHPSPKVLLNATNADVTAIDYLTGLFVDEMVDLVRRTVQETPIPATLHYAETAAQIGQNRTNQGYVIHDVPVLTVRSQADESLLAVLFGASTHPVCRGKDTTFDSDYCGAAAELIEQQLGAMAFFFLGLAGDINPIGEDTDRIPTYPDEIGSVLGDAVIDLVNNGSFTQLSGGITTELRTIDLPFSVDTGNAAVRAALKSKFNTRVGPNPPTGTGTAERAHAQMMIDQINAGKLPTSVPMTIQRWRLGGLTILALANEVVSGYHYAIKAIADELEVGNLWIMGYANEVNCYVPSDSLLWAGGTYEAAWDGVDNSIASLASSQIVYGWPSPLKASPSGTSPATASSAEGLILQTCQSLLA
ncbi:hypothetical protein [Actinokineospora globicatena]|uniref:Neutral/alkaline non-lysosomal ceramidase, N-terminal n=1 Tax=Actinokineospora globicatena TaxID=103729 RepID=A0A9W6V5M9_9PSEU|nr:hypothetical protein [Actinokineospora globicatena]GLW90545.1 hypothetical protein Aglo03_13610 [Actinokineospora globicatena]